jgi:uncharacterized protein (TIGR03067 family)
MSCCPPILDVPEEVMAVDNSAKMTMAASIVGAIGAIAAAIIPLYFNRPGAVPVRAASKAEVGPAAAKTDPAPPTAKAELIPPVAKGDPASRVVPPGSKEGPSDARKTHHSAVASNAVDVSKAPPIGTTKAERKATTRDLVRLHGNWLVVEQTNPKKAVTKKELVNSKPVWEFRGSTLTVRHAGVVPAVVIFQGSIKLYPNTSPKGFDFTGKDRSDQAVELLGIYSFDGPDLMIRYRIHHPDVAGTTSRPDSFKFEPSLRPGWLLRLRQIKE